MQYILYWGLPEAPSHILYTVDKASTMRTAGSHSLNDRETFTTVWPCDLDLELKTASSSSRSHFRQVPSQLLIEESFIATPPHPFIYVLSIATFVLQ